MFRASLWPSSGDQGRLLLHMVFCTGCAGCGCVELSRKLCALCEGYCSTRMIPETCWDRSLIINIGLVASCWFISLHLNNNPVHWLSNIRVWWKMNQHTKINKSFFIVALISVDMFGRPCIIRIIMQAFNRMQRIPFILRQMKHQLDATLCRFYFCRVTIHVSGASTHHQEYLKLVQRPLVRVLS